MSTVLETARGEFGVGENPPGSNTGARIRQYQAATWLPGTNWPWCAAFVNWVMREAGHPLPYRTAGAYDMGNWGRRQGLVTIRPMPGDIVVFNIGSGHVALVESVNDRDVTSIDGNAGDRVSRNTRPRSTVREFVRWPPAQKDVIRPVKPPRFEVVTSASGHAQVVFRGTRAQALKRVADRGADWLRKGKTVIVRRRR